MEWTKAELAGTLVGRKVHVESTVTLNGEMHGFRRWLRIISVDVMDCGDRFGSANMKTVRLTSLKGFVIELFPSDVARFLEGEAITHSGVFSQENYMLLPENEEYPAKED